jgi:excisionase family DNA binding protein
MNDTVEPDLLLTVPEVAKLLRLKESTIRAWVLRRRITFVKLGRRVFVQKKSCLELIERNVVKRLDIRCEVVTRAEK